MYDLKYIRNSPYLYRQQHREILYSLNKIIILSFSILLLGNEFNILILWDTIQVNLKPVSVFRQLPNILVLRIKNHTIFFFFLNQLPTGKPSDLRPNLFKATTTSTSGLKTELNFTKRYSFLERKKTTVSWRHIKKISNSNVHWNTPKLKYSCKPESKHVKFQET